MEWVEKYNNKNVLSLPFLVTNQPINLNWLNLSVNTLVGWGILLCDKNDLPELILCQILSNNVSKMKPGETKWENITTHMHTQPCFHHFRGHDSDLHLLTLTLILTLNWNKSSHTQVNSQNHEHIDVYIYSVHTFIKKKNWYTIHGHKHLFLCVRE